MLEENRAQAGGCTDDDRKIHSRFARANFTAEACSTELQGAIHGTAQFGKRALVSCTRCFNGGGEFSCGCRIRIVVHPLLSSFNNVHFSP